MNILILGDVCGSAGVKAVTERLPNLISQKKIDFTILNGENAAENGKGLTKKILRTFLKQAQT